MDFPEHSSLRLIGSWLVFLALFLPACTWASGSPTLAQAESFSPPAAFPAPPQELPEPGAMQDPRQIQCAVVANRLHDFFSGLDREEYFREFEPGMPAQQYFLDLAHRLLDNPPVVSRESDDLYTILKNMAHFFRIIGGKNILVVKAILDREREQTEDVAANLFAWINAENCEEPNFPFQAPPDRVYEYAGFFLTSMGGRSYLFRRDSRSRLLVNYYSILVIDRANQEGRNRHGIDIRPLLPTLANEIDASTRLIYKENYLDVLYELMERYQ